MLMKGPVNSSLVDGLHASLDSQMKRAGSSVFELGSLALGMFGSLPLDRFRVGGPGACEACLQLLSTWPM